MDGSGGRAARLFIDGLRLKEGGLPPLQDIKHCSSEHSSRAMDAQIGSAIVMYWSSRC